MQIEYLSTADLIPYTKNPRKNDGAAEAVAESIKEFGFKVPILIDKDGTIIAGHTRLKAAQKLELDKVPVIRLEHLSEEQARALRLVDNKISEFSTWDFSKLEERLEQIINIDMERFGFSNFENAELLEYREHEERKHEQGEKHEKELPPRMVICPNCGEAFDANAAERHEDAEG